MCGLLGIAVDSSRPLGNLAALFPAALATLAHRGPDARGQYEDRNVLLGHVRLSILDLSDAGRQPMTTRDGRFVIAYNGEVYNFRELARQHELGDLRSGSDTEVVLRLFAKLGVAALPKLNGMFAFAVYDALTRKLWLARDRLGIKPLYFELRPGRLSFGSEIKGILALGQGAPRCELAALHEWIYYGNPLGGRTLYEGIVQLLPGQYLELDLQSFGSSTRPYWALEQFVREDAAAPAPTAAAAIEETRCRLERAVQRQLVSDVPVGLFLSGGVDSSAVAAFASRHYGGRLKTYSVGFDFSKDQRELERARRVAEQFGTEHHEIHIAGTRVSDLVEGLVRQHDMPFSDAANIPLALMAREISAHTKVVLQGDGGDELFGGYGRYFTLNHYRLLHLAALLMRHAPALAPKSALSYRVRRYLHALSAEDMVTTIALLLTSEDRSMAPTAIFSRPLRDAVEKHDPFSRHRECLRLIGPQDSFNRMSYLDLLITLPDTYLEKVDRATMAASLEVRVPFLDDELVEYVVRLPGETKAPGGKRKWLLKSALRGILPDEVLDGPKVGLEVPYGAWLQSALQPLFAAHLHEFSAKNPGVLDLAHVRTLLERTAAGVRDDSYMLWKLLNLMIWANLSRISIAVA